MQLGRNRRPVQKLYIVCRAVLVSCSSLARACALRKFPGRPAVKAEARISSSCPWSYAVNYHRPAPGRISTASTQAGDPRGKMLQPWETSSFVFYLLASTVSCMHECVARWFCCKIRYWPYRVVSWQYPTYSPSPAPLLFIH